MFTNYVLSVILRGLCNDEILVELLISLGFSCDTYFLLVIAEILNCIGAGF